MAKRYTDTTIWKKQRWFKKLSPIYKLAWKYITDTCDHAGILKIDFSEFVDDLNVDEFNIMDFIKNCNTDFDKENGKKIERERIKLLKNNVVWITGFIRFQYENKEFQINPSIPAIYSALTVLNSYGTLNEGLTKGYFSLSKPYVKGMLRTKDKDKDNIELGIDEDIYNNSIVSNMLKVFKKLNPKYPEDKTKDFTACYGIVKKIMKSKNWEPNEMAIKSKEILESWNIIVEFVISDTWYSGRALHDINNEWQRLIQSMNKNKINGTKISNGHSHNSKSAGAYELLASIKHDFGIDQ